jgi:Fic family protein
MAEVFKLEKPRLKIKTEDVLSQLRRPDIQKYIQTTSEPNYLYWDIVKYKTPDGLSPEEFWALVKFLREIDAQRFPTQIRSEAGSFFNWQSLLRFQESLHKIDMQLGGTLASPANIGDKEKRRYIARGIMEEAIASSQLEGANTTRKIAKQMLLEKRPPRSSSEHMIFNNYEAMLLIEEHLKESKLDLDILLNLHVTFCKNTLDVKNCGRLRKDEDGVRVMDGSGENIYHIPPNENFLKAEVKRLIAYANDELLDQAFVHPVIKAIILHFWIGYLHPFVDGNGRLARALFYWYLLRNDYWAFSYLPLSRVIKNSPKQYGMAYVYSEQDDFDLTYFIDYNVQKIMLSKREFDKYAERKQRENRHMEVLINKDYHLNDRQIQLLKYLNKNTDAFTTIAKHSKVYAISLLTARKDLITLEKNNFLKARKQGRERLYYASSRVNKLFEN